MLFYRCRRPRPRPRRCRRATYINLSYSCWQFYPTKDWPDLVQTWVEASLGIVLQDIMIYQSSLHLFKVTKTGSVLHYPHTNCQYIHHIVGPRCVECIECTPVGYIPRFTMQ